MHEYEFRLVVQSPESFEPLLRSLGRPLRQQVVYYVPPHFRFRDGAFEVKRVRSTQAVYHDGTWFRWVHSVETPYPLWSPATCFTFLHQIGNFQDPFVVEKRTVLDLDARAKLYTFRTTDRHHRLVFEYEHGTFPHALTRLYSTRLFRALHRYREVYHLLDPYDPVPVHASGVPAVTRKSVSCLETVPEGRAFVYAHKIDGVFGLVTTDRDTIKEKWEGYSCVVRPNTTTLGGDGFVFAAERVASPDSSRVYLLDVYQAYGMKTAKWSRRAILTELLPSLALPEGYAVQTYASDPAFLKTTLSDGPFQTDGYIVHDVVRDVIFKVKAHHSIDLVYHDGYFYLPDGRIRAEEGAEALENGCVYELSTRDGRVMRRRHDRFKGNTAAQLETIFSQHGWQGPPIEPWPQGERGEVRKKKKRKHYH